ncbi:MAG: 7TM diverse intracellular signaling domain-containing protein, partial [Desulfitobacteriaceae bacterium]|nr:7TM diverse intracellular signaling domain-containing protein [Desulfitobacteriaceae bacterium]
MQNRKLLILIWLTFLLIVPFLGGCSPEFSSNRPKAVEGILDLTQWPLDKEVIRLEGQWEFYWHQLLDPGELKGSGTQRLGYIGIPGSWNRYIFDDRDLSGDGYATYRLIFKTEETGRLGLKIPRIFTAYNLWVNEELIAAAGTVGKSRETMTPQYLPQVALFESRPGENEIVIQVANFYHRSGGILESLIIGNEKQIMGLRYKSIACELLLFGSLVIIGAYHLALFFFRRKNTAPLYFGLFCLFVGIRTLLVGERFFIYLFPDFGWEAAHKILTLMFYLGVPLILMFFKSVFPNDFHAKIVRFVQGVGLAFGGLVLLTPAKFFTCFNPAYQVFTLIVIIYILGTFIKILLRKEKGIGLIIVGALALILTSLNDIVFLSIWMNDHSAPFLRTLFRTGNLSSVGQLVFVFTNSLVLAKKFSNALEQEEVMTTQLKEMNLNLDELVKKRTKALEESREKIESQKLELEKANCALHLLSLKDPLTGLWNRRHYDDTILIEWNRGLRHKRPISLLV